MKTIYHTIHQAGVTMRSILQITRFKTGYLCLTALLTAVLMFCNQVYDNPVFQNMMATTSVVSTGTGLTPILSKS